MNATDTIKVAYDKCRNSNHQTRSVASSIYGDGTLFDIACAVIWLGDKYDGFIDMVGKQENYDCQKCTLDGIRWDDPEVDVDKINELFSTFVHSDAFINFSAVMAPLKPALDRPSEDQSEEQLEDQSEDPSEDLPWEERYYKMKEKDGWKGCISLEDLKREHPAGIFHKEHKTFYFLDEQLDLGYHELVYQDPNGGDKIMFDDWDGYAEFNTIEEELAEELKQIGREIKKNYDKLFDKFYL